MYSGKEAQGQSEIPEGHCIKEGKLFHLKTRGVCFANSFFYATKK